MSGRTVSLPVSGRPLPGNMSFIGEAGFLKDAAERSARTGATYVSALRMFADWLQTEAGAICPSKAWPLPPRGVTSGHVLDFRGWLIRHRSPKTAYTYISGVMSFLIYLEGRGLSPAGVDLAALQRQIARKKAPEAAEVVVERDAARQAAIPAIVDYWRSQEIPEPDHYGRRLTALRNRALVEVLFSTAGRISEVAAINAAAVGRGQSKVLVIGKGRRPRTLHLRPEARAAIDAYLAERGEDGHRPLFCSHSLNSRGRRLTTVSIHKVIKGTVAALGLDPEISAHDFRHFRAVTLLRGGMPLEAVQEYLGHASPATTRMIYAPVLGESLVADWLERLDS